MHVIKYARGTTGGGQSGVSSVFQRFPNTIRTYVEERAKSKRPLSFTAYFHRQWEKRGSGAMPTIKQVESMIRRAVRLQKCMEFYTPRGRPYRVLAMYWLPEQDIVLKVDERRRKIVSVFTPKMRNQNPGARIQEPGEWRQQKIF